MYGLRSIPQASAALPADNRTFLPRYTNGISSSGTPSSQSSWSRPQSAAPTATSKAMEYFRPLQAKFVRPDTDEAATDTLAAFVSRSSAPVAVGEKPQFRTALEQVSYETNSSRMHSGASKSRGFGIFDRAAKIFGK